MAQTIFGIVSHLDFWPKLELITGYTLRKVRQLLEEFIKIIINGDINIHMSHFVLVRKCLAIALWPPRRPPISLPARHPRTQPTSPHMAIKQAHVRASNHEAA